MFIFICSLNQKLILFVAGYDAVISAYEVNITDGGECPQIYSQYLLANLSVMGQSITSKPEQNAAGKFILKDHIEKFIPFITIR